MDIQNRRVTRALSNVNENEVLRKRSTINGVVGKGDLEPRKALVEQKNNQLTDRQVGKGATIKRSTRSSISVAVNFQKENKSDCQSSGILQLKKRPWRVPEPDVHPEVTGIDRELNYVEFSDQVYEYLLQSEKKSALDEGFMIDSPVTPKMRSILIDWLIQVHIRFHLLPETLHLTVFLVDTMLSTTKVDKCELQLVGVACMLVASKFEEMYAPDIHDFEYITDNAFTKRQILKMEQKVLSSARFDLSRPHSLIFLRWLSKEMEFGSRMHHMAKYIGELALLDYSLAHLLPSRVACAAVYLSTVLCSVPCNYEKMRDLTGIGVEEVQELARAFARVMVKLHSQTKLIAIRDKYSAAKLMAVSQLYDADIKLLISIYEH